MESSTTIASASHSFRPDGECNRRLPCRTLTFIPKLVAISGLTMVLTPWLLRALSEFTVTIITRMGALGH